MKRTTIYIEETKLNELKEFSYKRKMSMADSIRIAIDKLLEEKTYDKDRKLSYKDIIGIAEGPDTNNISEKVEDFLKEKFKK